MIFYSRLSRFLSTGNCCSSSLPVRFGFLSEIQLLTSNKLSVHLLAQSLANLFLFCKSSTFFGSVRSNAWAVLLKASIPDFNFGIFSIFEERNDSGSSLALVSSMIFCFHFSIFDLISSNSLSYFAINCCFWLLPLDA